MSNHSKDPSRSGFSLSNLQVMLLLLAAGILLIGVTFVFAKDIGRIPVSLWDICTTPAEPATAPRSSGSDSVSVSPSRN